MANPWFRLWVELPNDPKFRTISRLSGAKISTVIATYIHLLCGVANATERNRTQPNDTERGRTKLNAEDIAAALDEDTETIDQIFLAMEGRLLEGDIVTGWAKRQPIKEDGSAERSKSYRESKKEPNATERNRTQPNAQIREDKIREDKIRDIKDITISKEIVCSNPKKNQIEKSEISFEDFYKLYPKHEAKQAAARAWGKIKEQDKALIMSDIAIRKAEHATWLDGFIPLPATYLNGERWKDEIKKTRGNNNARPQYTDKIQHDRDVAMVLDGRQSRLSGSNSAGDFQATQGDLRGEVFGELLDRRAAKRSDGRMGSIDGEHSSTEDFDGS